MIMGDYNYILSRIVFFLMIMVFIIYSYKLCAAFFEYRTRKYIDTKQHIICCLVSFSLGLFAVIFDYLCEIYGVYEACEYALKSMAWR